MRQWLSWRTATGGGAARTGHPTDSRIGMKRWKGRGHNPGRARQGQKQKGRVIARGPPCNPPTDSVLIAMPLGLLFCSFVLEAMLVISPEFFHDSRSTSTSSADHAVNWPGATVAGRWPDRTIGIVCMYGVCMYLWYCTYIRSTAATLRIPALLRCLRW